MGILSLQKMFQKLLIALICIALLTEAGKPPPSQKGDKQQPPKKSKDKKPKSKDDWFGISTTDSSDHPWFDYSTTDSDDKPCSKDSKEHNKPRGNGRCKGKKCKNESSDSSDSKRTWWSQSTTLDPMETTDINEDSTTTRDDSECVVIEGALDPNNLCFCFNDLMDRCPDQCDVVGDECVDPDDIASDTSVNEMRMRMRTNDDPETDALNQHDNKEHDENGKFVAWIVVLICGIVIGVSLMIIACVVYASRRSKYNHIGNVDDVEGFEMNGDRKTLKEIDGQVAIQTIEFMDADNVSLPEPTM